MKYAACRCFCYIPLLCVVEKSNKKMQHFWSSEIPVGRDPFYKHTVSAIRKFSVPLTGHGWCNCPQHHYCKTQHFCLKWESCYLHGQSFPSVSCHHIRLWFMESELISLFLSSLHTQLKHWCKCQWLFTSPLTLQSRTFLYCELLHHHQEQMLVVLLTEYWRVVSGRTGQVI